MNKPGRVAQERNFSGIRRRSSNLDSGRLIGIARDHRFAPSANLTSRFHPQRSVRGQTHLIAMPVKSAPVETAQKCAGRLPDSQNIDRNSKCGDVCVGGGSVEGISRTANVCEVKLDPPLTTLILDPRRAAGESSRDSSAPQPARDRWRRD
jgi:hypothetical protein